MEHNNYVVVKDPGPYPLAEGAVLCLREVIECLKNHGFYTGTVLLDLGNNSLHTVVRRDKRLYLEPPSARISIRYDRILERNARWRAGKQRAGDSLEEE